MFRKTPGRKNKISCKQFWVNIYNTSTNHLPHDMVMQWYYVITFSLCIIAIIPPQLWHHNYYTVITHHRIAWLIIPLFSHYGFSFITIPIRRESRKKAFLVNHFLAHSQTLTFTLTPTLSLTLPFPFTTELRMRNHRGRWNCIQMSKVQRAAIAIDEAGIKTLVLLRESRGTCLCCRKW